MVLVMEAIGEVLKVRGVVRSRTIGRPNDYKSVLIWNDGLGIRRFYKSISVSSLSKSIIDTGIPEYTHLTQCRR